MRRKLNIYGDNVLECHDTAILLAKSLDAELSINIDSPLYAPIFTIETHDFARIDLQLIPGYGRWENGFDAIKILKLRGARLREAPDSIITEVIDQGSHEEEVPLLAFEFSGALPAGNNAWQRCGRALSCAESLVPYLYYAELGGMELDTNRQPKASRYPNPIVPFAYLSLGQVYEVLAMPVYSPSPSLPASQKDLFDEFFGNEEALEVIKAMLIGGELRASTEKLGKKALSVTEYLASKRRKEADIITPREWRILGELQEGEQKAKWLIQRRLPWRKKISIPTTSSLQKLKGFFEQQANAVCSSEMPFCILSADERENLRQLVTRLYPGKVSPPFLEWLGTSKAPLAICWIAGFKPRGDDSRPDRGLVPLLRMVLGEDHVEVLSVVYGPGKEIVWNALEKDAWSLAENNGLWQAIVNLSDGVLVDSLTSTKMKSQGLIIDKRIRETDNQYRQKSNSTQKNNGPIRPVVFGEHDVDAVLHFAFTSKESYLAEGLCNPPGGNWSGISIYDFQEDLEFRWTSLPRVSGDFSKRPDHLFQFKQEVPGRKPKVILIIESKDRAKTVEKDIGLRLANYFYELVKLDPNITRGGGSGVWNPFTAELRRHISNIEVITAAAFRFKSLVELQNTLNRARTDMVIGVEFDALGKSILHLKLKSELSDLLPLFDLVGSSFKRSLEVKIH